MVFENAMAGAYKVVVRLAKEEGAARTFLDESSKLASGRLAAEALKPIPLNLTEHVKDPLTPAERFKLWNSGDRFGFEPRLSSSPFGSGVSLSSMPTMGSDRLSLQSRLDKGQAIFGSSGAVSTEALKPVPMK